MSTVRCVTSLMRVHQKGLSRSEEELLYMVSEVLEEAYHCKGIELAVVLEACHEC